MLVILLLYNRSFTVYKCKDRVDRKIDPDSDGGVYTTITLLYLLILILYKKEGLEIQL